MRRLALLLLPGIVAVAACGGPDMTDSGHADVRTDARTDARADVPGTDVQQPDVQQPDVQQPDVQSPDVQSPDVQSPDVVTDTGTDVASDAGTDAASDAGIDAASDAGIDVVVADSTVSDAAVDTGVDAVVADTGCVVATEICNGVDDNCNGAIDEVAGCGSHLLISEVVAAPTPGEYIEIFNPTSATINLANVYLSDWEQYYRLVTAAGDAAVSSSDFIARFPDGATIAPGAYQTVSTQSADMFTGAMGFPGVCPTYSLVGASASTTCAATRAMRTAAGATVSTIGSAAGLTNGGEPITLFQWDGVTDLVTDLDYVFYGMPSSATSNLQVDKTGVSIDGPNADTTASTYLADTAAASQSATPAPPSGGSAVRCDYTESTEVHTGGNGLGGHNETSEPLATTFRTTDSIMHDGGSILLGAPSPNTANNCH